MSFKKYLKEFDGISSGRIFEDLTVQLGKIGEVYDTINKMAGDLTFNGRKDPEYLEDLSKGFDELKEMSQDFIGKIDIASNYIDTINNI